uniref:Peptidase metallopeptidase domain-containing protein n=1 Tax=Populus alba TaxID=43335 RepID=A0A4U5QDD6_POPAL|nr:hypothetical protein D5086_0000116460 [Populus alba]
MAPNLSHPLSAILVIFSIQSFRGQARTLKPEHRQSFSSFLQGLEGVQKGQTVEGLIELKQYLKKLGTIQQMVIPRCGMPDIINTPSTKPNSTTSKHNKFHMVVHYAFGTQKWPPSKYSLTYRFGSGVQVVGSDTLRSVCSNAFQTWAKVSPFTFQEATAGASADIVIEFYSGDHGDQVPFDGPGNQLAHAFFPQDGRLHYDADENWSTDPAMDQTDLESVTVHEIGHLLGLYHSKDHPEAIIFVAFAKLSDVIYLRLNKSADAAFRMQNLFRFRELSEFDDKKRIEAVVDVFPIRTQGDVSHNLRQSGSVQQGHHHHFMVHASISKGLLKKHGSYLPTPCADELAILGAPMDPEDLTNKIMDGLDDDYKELVCTVQARDNSISFDELHEKFLSFEATSSSHATPLPIIANPTQKTSHAWRGT